MEGKACRIGEVARILGVRTSAIRFWEDEFRQLRPRRTSKGQRYYYEKDIALLRDIRNLLHEDGMTIDGAKKLLKKRAAEQKTDLDSDENSLENKTSLPEKTPDRALSYAGPNSLYPAAEQLCPSCIIVSDQQNIRIPLAPECENCQENHQLSAENVLLKQLVKEIAAELAELRSLVKTQTPARPDARPEAPSVPSNSLE